MTRKADRIWKFKNEDSAIGLRLTFPLYYKKEMLSVGLLFQRGEEMTVHLVMLAGRV